MRVDGPVPGREFTWYAHTAAGEPREAIVFPMSPDPDIREAALAALQPLRLPGPGHRQQVLDLTPCRRGVAIVAQALSSPPARPWRGLSVGQLVTLGRPLAQELAALHERGIVFGAPDLARETGYESGGRPVLVLGSWAGRRLAGTCEARPRDDHAALVAFLRRAVGPAQGRTADRLARVWATTDCAGTALALRRLGRPKPLPALPLTGSRGADAASGPPPLRRASGPASGSVSRVPAPLARVVDRLRPAWAPLALGLAVAAVALIGWRTAGGTRGSGPVAASSIPSGVHGVTPKPRPIAAARVDWNAQLAVLDQARSAAFAGTGALSAVDAVGSAAYDGDQQRLDALVRQGLRPRGLNLVLASVRPLAATATSARVLVTDTLPSYDLVSASGTIVARNPARATRSWTVTLARTAAGWRIAAIETA